jgi:hypothetical protein
MRELWVRDRLDVAGKPVVLDSLAGNSLLWTATGLYAPTAAVTDLTNYYTKTEADTLFLTSTEADALFLTPAEGNAAYATSAHNHDTVYVPLTGGSVMTGLLGPSTHNTRDLGTTALRWRKLWAVDGEFTNAPTVGGVALLTSTTADALFLTPTEGNAAYVQLTGGSVLTGLLGPTTNNTRDLGTSTLRWRTAYLAGSLNFDDALADPRITFYSSPYFGIGIAGGMLKYSAGVATNRHSFQVAAVERWSVSDASAIAAVPVTPDANNTRDLGTTALRWKAYYGMTGDLTTSLTVASKLVGVSATGGNTLSWNSDGFYVAAGAVTDIWVNTVGDTMTGDLNMTANVLPTVTNVRSLGSTSLRWLKVWAQDADFTNAPTVGGSALLTSTTADALFLTPAEGDAAYVNATSDTMSGTLGVGGLLTASAGLAVTGDTTAVGNVTIRRDSLTTVTVQQNTTDVNGPEVVISKSRGTNASPTIVSSGDTLGNILFRGYTSGGYGNFAAIGAAADAAAGLNDSPGRLSLFTTADGSATLVERLRIDNGGLIGIGGRATGAPASQLDVQSITAAGRSVDVRAHASTANSIPWFLCWNAAGQGVFGVNNLGWMADLISATALGTFATKRIPVYNSAGTLQGYLPLYN